VDENFLKIEHDFAKVGAAPCSWLHARFDCGACELLAILVVARIFSENWLIGPQASEFLLSEERVYMVLSGACTYFFPFSQVFQTRVPHTLILKCARAFSLLRTLQMIVGSVRLKRAQCFAPLYSNQRQANELIGHRAVQNRSCFSNGRLPFAEWHSSMHLVCIKAGFVEVSFQSAFCLSTLCFRLVHPPFFRLPCPVSAMIGCFSGGLSSH
jgi:hypothetical protein